MNHKEWMTDMVMAIEQQRKVYNEENLSGDELRARKHDATREAFDKVLHVFYKEYGLSLDEMSEILEKKKIRHAYGVKNAAQWR
jgi:hypothetical protein